MTIRPINTAVGAKPARITARAMGGATLKKRVEARAILQPKGLRETAVPPSYSVAILFIPLNSYCFVRVK
jgi:hypothetical protein